MNITKAIIPAAGLGTRFLPITKAIPKELLPILNKPAIHYIMDEGVKAHIHNWCIITNNDKHALSTYLSHDTSLATMLTQRNKSSLLSGINNLIDQTKILFTLQQEPVGLGHAIACAQEWVGDEWFAVFLPDDIIIHTTPMISSLITIAQEYNAAVIAVMEIPQDQTESYGIVRVQNKLNNGIYRINDLVEKPHPSKAPSNLAIVGRYILPPSIFQALNALTPSIGGEIQLTDGIQSILQAGRPVYAVTIKGDRFDVGTPQGWLEANIALSKNNPSYAL